MLKFIFLHFLRWTSILLISLVALGVGIFFLDFKHALTEDPKLNFIYTCLLTVGIIPVVALLFGGLTVLKKAIDDHARAEASIQAEPLAATEAA